MKTIHPFVTAPETKWKNDEFSQKSSRNFQIYKMEKSWELVHLQFRNGTMAIFKSKGNHAEFLKGDPFEKFWCRKLPSKEWHDELM